MVSNRGKIIVVTNPTDPHSDAVIHRLYALGEDVVRFHPAECVGDAFLSITPSGVNVEIPSSSRSFTDTEVKSVWYRRPGKVGGFLGHLSPPDAYISEKEITATLWGLYTCLDAVWYSDPTAQRRAAWKLGQLKLAAQIGLNCPDYIISNDTVRLKMFAVEHPQITIKPLHENMTFFEEDGRSYSIYVKPQSSKHLDQLFESRPTSPIFLQNFITKKYDVRITVIGQEVFAVAIHQPADRHISDFRPHTFNLKHEQVDCPDLIRVQLLEYLTKMNLNFGAFDFAIDSEDCWWFLECNPNGQWLWLEALTGVPLVNSMAEHLALRLPPLNKTHC